MNSVILWAFEHQVQDWNSPLQTPEVRPLFLSLLLWWDSTGTLLHPHPKLKSQCLEFLLPQPIPCIKLCAQPGTLFKMQTFLGECHIHLQSGAVILNWSGVEEFPNHLGNSCKLHLPVNPHCCWL